MNDRRKEKRMAHPNFAMNLLRASGCIVFALCCIVDGSKPHRMHLNGTATGEHAGIQQRRDFFRKLIVTTILEQPYMMLKPNSPYLAGNDRFEGYLADILMKLATSAGFQYEIRLARDGRYGEHSPNGQWDGMIGEVIDGDADIAAGAIIVTDGKSDFVDFTEPFLSLRSSALIRKPKSKQRPQRITTVDQMLAYDITFGVVEHGVAYRILEASNDPLKTKLWKRMIEFKTPVLVFGVQEGIDRARREDYAFILDSPMAEFVATRRPCDLYATEPFLDVMTYAFAMRRDDSRLRSVIDSELKKMKLSDEMQTMYLRWWRDECDDAATKTELDQTTERKRNTVERKPSPVIANSHVSHSSSGRVRIQPLLLTAICILSVAGIQTS